MPRAVVLGAGMVGSLIAVDLAEDSDFEVTSVDARESALANVRARSGGAVRTQCADLSRPGAVRELVEPFDIALGALASGIGFATLREVILAGRNYCDISFMPENALELDELAKEHGVTAIVDCGVAPGVSNLLAGCACAQLDSCESIEIYVGGLPRRRRWPFQYKAAFSPADVIEEYTRPARLVEHGLVVTRPALSEPELVYLPGVDTLEAFNTDGLRTLIDTLDVPNMKEKTLRYPGHIEQMRVFRDTGLFSKEPIEAGGVSVAPLAVTSALLFAKWSYDQGEEDLTVMCVVARGQRDGEPRRLTWDLLDFYDADTEATSMARTTAFPCAIMARLIAGGAVKRKGVAAPESLGDDGELVAQVLDELARRGVRYTFQEDAG